MDIFQAIVLGLIEGITEFLPISSTGHLILGATLLDLQQTEFVKTFEIAIQLGAILSVIALYWRAFFLSPQTLKRIIVAFLPTAIVGAGLYKLIKGWLGNDQIVLWALLLGGFALIAFEYWHREANDAHEDLATLPYKKAVLIGLAQALAVVPGVSRAAATILGGLVLGLKRKTIVEFSFLLAVPTMLGATVWDLSQSAGQFGPEQFGVLAAGFITAFITALMTIKFLLRFIQHHSFAGFGIYRILLALAFWLVIL